MKKLFLITLIGLLFACSPKQTNQNFDLIADKDTSVLDFKFKINDTVKIYQSFDSLNPFEKQDFDTILILCIKDNYIQYKYLSMPFKDIINSRSLDYTNNWEKI